MFLTKSVPRLKMKPLKSNTLLYQFKSDDTLIYFKLKPAGKLLNLTGSSKYFEIPVSYINDVNIKDGGHRYIIDLKVNRFNFNSGSKKYRHMRFFLLKGVEERLRIEEFFGMLERQVSSNLWQQTQISNFNTISA